MYKILLTIGLAISFAACAPRKLDLAPIPVPQDLHAVPTFGTQVLQHTHYLRSKYKHGHALAIAYVYNYADLAKKVQHEYGIPAEIVLAVGLLESGMGGSNIAQRAFNHFGIKKGDGWAGAVFVCGNGSSWRAYPTVEASYMGFGAFMQQRVPSFIAAPSVEAFAATGYAGTGKKAKAYAAQLNKIITRYELAHLFSL